MAHYRAWNEQGSQIEFIAGSFEDAKTRTRTWVRESHYDRSYTFVKTYIVDLDTNRRTVLDVEVMPDQPVPKCQEPDGHRWVAPSWLGGSSDNPGVRELNGYRLEITKVCSHCGAFQVYRSACKLTEIPEHITYREPSPYSRSWVGKFTRQSAPEVEG